MSVNLYPTVGFVAPNQANAESPSNGRAQISQQRPRPQNESQKPDDKPQVKHQPLIEALYFASP